MTKVIRIPHTCAALMLIATGIPGGAAYADMQSLDDGELSRIQGQSGITLEMDLQLSADRVSYYDDGRGAHLEGFKMGSSDTLGQGRPVNGSGTAILLNYIHTSDGGDFDGDGQDDNTYGIRTDLAVDVSNPGHPNG